MPIYEFKCLKCGEFFEVLFKSGSDEVEMKCKSCGDANIERVLSSTNYAMGAGGGASSATSSQTRTCSSGSCTTYTVPGHTR